MKKELLKKILVNWRDSMNTNKKMREALELYTDGYVSFSDQHLTNIVRDVLEEEYCEYGVEMIYNYLSDGLYYVIDRDKVEPDKEGNKFLMGGAENNPDKVKEVITDDDRFISYFLENYD